MAKKTKNIGIFLLICIALLWIPIPFIDGKIIASATILLLSIYLITK